MSKKYVHFELTESKTDEKKIMDYIENKYSHMSMKVLFIEMVLRDMEKLK